MGSCLCREETPVGEELASCSVAAAEMPRTPASAAKRPRIMDSETVEQLVIDVLCYITTCQDGGEEEPLPLVKIALRADTEEGWCEVILGLITAIPFHDPLSLSAIAVIFDYCPLPPRDTVIGFTQSLHLSAERCALAYASEDSVRQERNLLFVLCCIAVKFASHSSVHILTEDLLDYLITFLVDERSPILVLGALVALEKLGGTAQNKAAINAALSRCFLHPLLPLELLRTSPEYEWRCVGFQARWMLDNLFLFPERKYSYEVTSADNINVLINIRDMSHYLKLSPEGLEVRTDSHTFESARATFKVKTGYWYYEVEVITCGVMQIGWASRETNFESQEGFGVGDDQFSVSYDGCRRLIWHKARSTLFDGPVDVWRPGDILGCLVDATKGEATFSVNGVALPPFSCTFLASGEGFYPAGSFMANQQCVFNFGARAFRFPPMEVPFRNMNYTAKLLPEQKLIIPRRIEVALLERDAPVTTEFRCAVCLEAEGGFGIDPCRHGGFCARCVLLLEECPLCRCGVKSIYLDVI